MTEKAKVRAMCSERQEKWTKGDLMHSVNCIKQVIVVVKYCEKLGERSH